MASPCGEYFFKKITKTSKSSQNGSPWLENQHLRDKNASFFRAGAHGGHRFGQNHRFCSVFDDFGRRGSKINISMIKMHHVFVPELMAAAVLVKTIVFDKFLIFMFLILFVMFGVTRWDNFR